MIETVKREKKLYCKVHIPDFFAEDSDYPLTYVPFWAMSLPLREGDKVMVETAYVVGTAEPFPAIRIVNAEDSSIE